MSMNSTEELIFQSGMIAQVIERGWVHGRTDGYDREHVLYSQDALTLVQTTRPQEWEKFAKIYSIDTKCHFLGVLVAQLRKVDINATDILSRAYDTLGALCHGIRSHNARFSLRRSKPEHNLNPETLSRHKQNIRRIVLELVYNPHASSAVFEETGIKAKKWCINLVLFVNGLPIVTPELKSEFKQMVQNVIMQYKKTRLSKDPGTNRPGPLLTSKRGVLVYLVVGQHEVSMITKLNGDETSFPLFNKSIRDGGAGDDIPEDVNDYVTSYLQNEVLLSGNLLKIPAGFVYL